MIILFLNADKQQQALSDLAEALAVNNNGCVTDALNEYFQKNSPLEGGVLSAVTW